MPVNASTRQRKKCDCRNMGLWLTTSRTSNGMFTAGAAITVAASKFSPQKLQGSGKKRRALLFRPHSHEGLTVTFGYQCPVLLEGFMVKFDDPRAGARFRFSLAYDLRRAMHRVAFK